jgi:hypothetical protein
LTKYRRERELSPTEKLSSSWEEEVRRDELLPTDSQRLTLSTKRQRDENEDEARQAASVPATTDCLPAIITPREVPQKMISETTVQSSRKKRSGAAAYGSKSTRKGRKPVAEGYFQRPPEDAPEGREHEDGPTRKPLPRLPYAELLGRVRLKKE